MPDWKYLLHICHVNRIYVQFLQISKKKMGGTFCMFVPFDLLFNSNSVHLIKMTCIHMLTGENFCSTHTYIFFFTQKKVNLQNTE